MPRVPHIVQHHQYGLVLYQGAQQGLALDFVAERLLPPGEGHGQVFLACGQVGLPANGQPHDAVGEGGAQGGVSGQGRGQHRLADAAHTPHSHDAYDAVAPTQDHLPHLGHILLAGDEMLGQFRDAEQGQLLVEPLPLQAAQHPHHVVISGDDHDITGVATQGHGPLAGGQHHAALAHGLG